MSAKDTGGSAFKVGDRIKDNDPRMGNRVLTIMEIGSLGGYVYACDGIRHSLFRIRADRIYTDGKARRSGFSLAARKEAQ